MKNSRSFLMVAAFFALFYQNCQNPKISREKIVDKIYQMPEARLKKNLITEQTAVTFPGTMIYFAKASEIRYYIFLNSLPTVNKQHEMVPDISKLPHGNATCINYAEDNIVIIPKHLFEDDSVFLEYLQELGADVTDKGDFLVLRGFDFSGSQNPLNSKLLDEPKNDFAIGQIRTLNDFPDQNGIYSYFFDGQIEYFTEEEMFALIGTQAKNSQGEVEKFSFDRGAYLMKVPNSVRDEILGMSGGSLIARDKGKEVFLGINVSRLTFGFLGEKGDTIMNTIMAVQPILENDVKN